MFKDLFQKKKYATIPSATDRPKRDIPEGLMNKCPKCGNIQYGKELEKNLKVCSSCGHHFRLNAWERIQMITDDGSFKEFDAELESVDPLEFPGYASKLEAQKKNSGLREAVVTGEGTIGSFPAVVAVMSFDFFSRAAWGRLSGKKLRVRLKRHWKNRFRFLFSRPRAEHVCRRVF